MMDEITAAEIRKWAWEQLENFAPKGQITMDLYQRIASGDVLAAWVMSSKLPETTPTQQEGE